MLTRQSDICHAFEKEHALTIARLTRVLPPTMSVEDLADIIWSILNTIQNTPPDHHNNLIPVYTTKEEKSVRSE